MRKEAQENTMKARSSSASDHGACALVCENLKQKGVWDTPINDTSGVYTLCKGANAAFHFGYHPTSYLPVGHHLPHPSNVDLLHQAPRVITVRQNPRHIREQQQLLGAHGSCYLTSRRIGIDVIGLPSLVGGHGGDNWDMSRGDDGMEDGGVHARDLADESQRRCVWGRARGDEARVLAAEANGGASRNVDEGDEVLVDLPHEHHLDDLHGERVRDAEAVAELRLDADAQQPGVNLRAPAVDEHGAEADAGEEHEVADHGRLQLRGLHRRTAVLDHHRLALESLDERESLREHVHSAQRRGGSGRRRRRSRRSRGCSGDAEAAAPASRGGKGPGMVGAEAESGTRGRRGWDWEERVGEVGFRGEHGCGGWGTSRRRRSTKCQAGRVFYSPLSGLLDTISFSVSK